MNFLSLRRLFGLFLMTLMLPWLSVFATGYGLIVGIDRYDHRYVMNDLDCCVHDATGIRQQLVANVARWPHANCSVLTNSAATKTAVRAKLSSLASTAVSGDVVVYFQSSHGGSWSEGGTNTFLCTYNDSYEDYELASDLASFKTGVKVIVIVDACYAAGLFKGTTASTNVVRRWNFAQNVTTHMQKLHAQKMLAEKGASVGWLTACDYDEESWENDPYGLFAGYVIQGFQNGDANLDGQVTFLELFNYAYPLTRVLSTEYGEEQDPQALNTSLLGSTVAGSVGAVDSSLALSNALDSSVLTWTTGGGADWFGEVDESSDGVSAARSGIIGSSSETWMQTTVTGPGVLGFKWKVSSDDGYDYLRFYCDGVQQGSGLTGEQGWTSQQYTLAAGTHTLRWVYSKDEVINDGSDCGWVDQVAWLATCTVTLNAEGGSVSPSSMTVSYGSAYGTLPTPTRSGYLFTGWWTSEDETGMQIKANIAVSTQKNHTLYAHWLPVVSLSEALDEPEWVWTTGGDTNWLGVQTVVGYDGVDSARSGVLTNSAQTWLQTTVTGPVTLSFWWRVSSSNGTDYLSFLIDGVEQAGKISGETDWAQARYLLSRGSHTVRWLYTKKTTMGQGDDCGWVDQVALEQGNISFAQSIYTTSGEGNAGTGGVSAVVPVWGVGPVSATVTVVPGSATTADYSTSISGSNLTWASGESGFQYVTVPIIGDTQVEGNEVFYLVLGDPKGGTLGDTNVCAVVITDDDAGSVADKGSYVSGVAVPPEGGRVTGGGYCPVGRSVKVTAAAKTGWTFLRWEDGSQAASRTVAGALAAEEAQNGAMLCRAFFKQTSEIGVPETSNPGAQTAVVGVAYRLALPVVSDNLPTLKISGLPAGVKLDANTVSLVGVPSKAGSYTVTFSASNVAGAGTSQTFTITVSALPTWAQGTFYGMAQTESLGSGMATMSVTALGKLTGKILLAGSNYSFSATSFSEMDDSGSLSVVVTAKVSKVAIPIEISISLPESEAAGFDLPSRLGKATGTFGDGTVTLYRSVWKDSGMTDTVTNYAGYYTAVLPPDDDEYGSGYLTFTVNKLGGVKTTGKLADGTAVSLSGSLVLDEAGRIWTVLYTAPSAYNGGTFFGVTEFVQTDGTSSGFVRPLEDTAFNWSNLSPQATASYGTSFTRAPGLVGGWYSTTGNLYAYYEGLSLSVGVNIGSGDPVLTVGTNQYTSVWWDPEGVFLTVVTNKTGTMTGLSASVVNSPTATDDGWSYDTSDNTVGLTLTLKRATGLYSGSFKAWFDYGTTHTSKKISFQGVLTPVRENMDDDIVGRGFFLWAEKAAYLNALGKTATYSVNESYDFQILSGAEIP